MSEAPEVEPVGIVDVGEYCRQIEAHLTRVNDGQIIRIVGPAFELARGWAHEGVPLSIVCHGIDRKAERHRAGASRRALRLEFCEADVLAVYDQWQRAIGLRRPVPTADGDEAVPIPDRKPPSLTRHLDRAIDRLVRATSQLDRSEAFRDTMGRVLEDLAEMRDAVKGARGPTRAAIADRLPELDRILVDAGRLEVGEEKLGALARQAADELHAFRGRLAASAWDRSVELSVTRLLREHLGLPTLVEP